MTRALSRFFLLFDAGRHIDLAVRAAEEFERARKDADLAAAGVPI